MAVEWLPLVMNTGITISYLVRWSEPGKIVYWIGATILTMGLLLMKG